MRIFVHAAILITFLSLTLSANAGEILKNEVKSSDGVYKIKTVAVIDAPKDKVIKLLTDYDNLNLISPTIIESEKLENGTVKTVAEGCVLFFCQKITNVQTMTKNDDELSSKTDESKSDISGFMNWKFSEKDGKTKIEYNAEIVPKFFVPILIGPYLLRGKLTEESEISINKIEELAG